MVEKRITMPSVNKRIKEIIDTNFNGNVRQFALHMGLTDSSKINRLFNVDKRSNDYPLPSTEIILLIANSFGYSTDWLLKGVDPYAKSNVININKRDIKGNNNNVVGDNNNNISNGDTSELLSVIKKQQEQIDKLLKLL